MAQINLNIPRIRDGKAKEVVSYLDELRHDQSERAICMSLFEAVNDEYLSPNIFSTFLSWSKSLHVISLCIHAGPSRFIRNQGIKQFGKALADPKKWESAWREVGGTEGLIKLFAKISVIELKALARAIGRCNRAYSNITQRERAIEGLLHGLLPSHYPGSKFQNPDKRPIQHYYAQMIPACSPQFVGQILDARDQSNPLYRKAPWGRLIKTHGELLRNRVIESLSGNGCEEKNLHQCLEAFVYREPSRPGTVKKVSASMAYAMQVLQLRLEGIDNDESWPTTISEASVILSLLHRSLKRRLSESQIHDVIMLALQLVKAKPNLKSAFKSANIWSKIITRWKKIPNLYEDSVILALRLELCGSQKKIGVNFLHTSQSEEIGPELRWPLLRLYCLHVPRRGIDINTTSDFNPLAKQLWSSDIFYSLDRDKAVILLKGLLNVNREYSFLAGPSSSILQIINITSQRNFNVALLLTLLQRSSVDVQRRADGTVDQLRKKSATAKEQPDRAEFAKAAAAYAIASGNLDLYHETVTWQQRFVRDPLTVKVVFSRDAVATNEGIELLCGIPEELPEGITLAEVASRVEKANEILMIFHETMLTAKREPSFHQSDWDGVTRLFGAAITLRAERAKDLQKRLQDSETDVYTAMWDGTLAMLEKVNVHFIWQVYKPIKTLLFALPPSALSATAKAMLEAGQEKRQKQDRQPADDVLERLSYQVLKRLAQSDKPELAQQLVLQTILDRPDASSWHRQFLSQSFMKCLSAKDAQEILLAFATAIGEKLEEQSYVKVGEPQLPESAPPQSLVKVTTVKYLAQLLDNAEFISADAAVEVLVELFMAGKHRDIRLATLDSLLSLLDKLCSGADESWRSNPLTEKIMGAIETVIPVVGSVNERHPPRQEDWEEAKETGILPEVSNSSDDLPPLLKVLFTAPNESQYPELENLQAEFVERFLLPILEHSQEEHRKWVSLFLLKHKVDLTIDDLPPVPISWKLWGILVRNYPKLIPQRVLEDFNKYISMTIAPPTALKHFNKSLRKNIDLCNTPEVQHWLGVFGQTMSRYNSSGLQTLLQSIIHYDWSQPSVPSGIDSRKTLEMVIAHASLFLDEYEHYEEIWDDFVKDLRLPTKLTYSQSDANSLYSMVTAWQKSGRVILERVTALVLDKENQHKRKHKHSILPSTLKLRLWLLPYPCSPDPAEIDSQCKVFVKEMNELLGSFLDGESNVLRWPRIAENAFTVSKLLNTDVERLSVALYCGRLVGRSDRATDQKSSAMNFVRVALVIKLVEDGRGGLTNTGKGELSEERKRLADGLKKIIQGWQSDFDESIREKVGDWKREEKILWENLMGIPAE